MDVSISMPRRSPWASSQGSRDNDQWYDLSGRRIANSSIKPGIYIINDKKVNITK